MGNLQQQKKENIEFNPNLLTTTVQNSLAFPGSVNNIKLEYWIFNFYVLKFLKGRVKKKYQLFHTYLDSSPAGQILGARATLRLAMLNVSPKISNTCNHVLARTVGDKQKHMNREGGQTKRTNRQGEGRRQKYVKSCYLLLAICHLLLVSCYMLLAIYYLLCATCFLNLTI